MTFPGGTHDLWLRYWIQACGVDASTLSIQPIPPPQMVANMQAGTVQGYCVGEPWGAVAVTQDIGFTHLATQDLWLHHPEKALRHHRPGWWRSGPTSSAGVVQRAARRRRRGSTIPPTGRRPPT